MDPRNEQKFFKDFDFLSHSREDPSTGLTHIACGDGWRLLLYSLFKEIESHLKNEPDFRIYQIKEKFGRLRIYSSASMGSKIDNLILQAEKTSEKICEKCGDPGKMRRDSWAKVLCDKCF